MSITRRIIVDGTKFSYDYVPDTLPCREHELEMLHIYFQPVLDSNISENVAINGPVGTGKTVLSKYFTRDFSMKCRVREISQRTIYINCRLKGGSYNVMHGILSQFDDRFPERGFSIEVMLNALLKHLINEECRLIIILDEIDTLLKTDKSNLIYNLTRAGENLEDKRRKFSISIIGIALEPFIDLLDQPSSSTFKKTRIIILKKYTKEQLFEILKHRASVTLRELTYNDTILETIAEIASQYGDARYAIEYLEKSALIAEHNNQREISIENVRLSKSECAPVFSEEKIENLDYQELLVLLSIARLLKNKSVVSTGEVERLYTIICEEFNVKSKSHAQVFRYIQSISNEGLITVKKSALSGARGQTTMISLSDIPAEQLANILEALLKRRK